MIIIENLIITSLTILIILISARLLIEFIISYNQSEFNRNKFFFRYLFIITEPFSLPFRRILPLLEMIDISPIFAIAFLGIIRTLLIFFFAQFNFVLKIT
jgi:uncharacterized protein YggT (Ycf19 family)